MIMTIKSFPHQAKVLLHKYLLGDSFLPYTSILGGILVCKVIYDLTQLFSALYFRSYESLTRIQKVEWNNRGMSTTHAVFIGAMSLYFVFWSDLFVDDRSVQLITYRSSLLSNFSLGVSVGYFVSDLGLLLWFYPSLGGKEFVLHHALSGIAVGYSLFSKEGQLYTFMILISEVTTPVINMRWFLVIAELKESGAYVINGVLIFLAWLVSKETSKLVARILLFVYMFWHVYLHYNQVVKMQPFGFVLVFVVPSILTVLNLMWFGKIVKGLIKTLRNNQ
ncbi:hypothetical protein V2J09_002294 [Rumex salicifolius]